MRVIVRIRAVGLLLIRWNDLLNRVTSLWSLAATGTIIEKGIKYKLSRRVSPRFVGYALMRLTTSNSGCGDHLQKEPNWGWTVDSVSTTRRFNEENVNDASS